MTFAFDRSVRTTTSDGHLRVAVSPISKATVNPYYGREIPDGDKLGLQANQIYYLLRDPDELAKAAPTFNNLPILIKHQPVSADDHPRELTVGTTGSDARFESPYLLVSMSFWDAAAIAGIESKEQAELSSGYRYTADMTSGEYEGVKYDGIMRNIQGNHVALVDVGRAGHDVVVQDQSPFKHEVKPMTKAEKLALARTNARNTARDKLRKMMAADADPDQVEKVLKEMAEHEAEEIRKVEDEDPDPIKPKAEDEDEDDPKAKDEDPDMKPEVTKAAMDAAIKIAQDQATAAAVAKVTALYEAREVVKPLVGAVAMDSADDVYKFALDQKGVPTKGVHPSAYKPMVDLLLKQSAAPAPRMAADAAAVKSITDKHPHLARFGS